MDARLIGRVDYAACNAAMQAFTANRDAATSDALWLVEHNPTFTQGLAGKAEHLLVPGNIPVVSTNRGGQVTYHGPGQVVAYPLLDLQRLGYFVKEYVYRLEEAVIRTLAYYGVTGHRVAGAPGIYVRLDDPRSHAMLEQRPQRREPGSAHLNLTLQAWAKCSLGHQGQPPLHLSWRGTERGHGPRALSAHQSMRVRRHGHRRSFYNRRSDNLERGRASVRPRADRPPGSLRLSTMSSNEVVREAQSAENYNPLAKQKAAAKLSRIPVKVEQAPVLKKPEWIRVKAGSPTTRFYEIKDILREQKLHTVCEEASCPNIGECFGKGTATFMIMGDKCTRRCPFCAWATAAPIRWMWTAPQAGRDHCPPASEVCGDHQRGPRRPARRWLWPLCGVHQADTRPVARDAD